MKFLHCIALILLIIGGINWGFIGFFDVNLLHKILANFPKIEQVIYAIVGISAIYAIFYKCCTKCCTKKTA